MYVNINPQKVKIISAELLDLSHLLRQSREGTEGVRYQLRQLTELDVCKAAIRKQENNLAELTARLVNISLVLREIAEIYQSSEERIQDILEEGPSLP